MTASRAAGESGSPGGGFFEVGLPDTHLLPSGERTAGGGGCGCGGSDDDCGSGGGGGGGGGKN